MKELSLTREQLDVLREIGTVGGGNAATALNQLLYKKISVNIPNVGLISLDKLSGFEFFPHPEELGIAISLKILGKLKGGMLVLFPQKSALSLIDILTQKTVGSTEVFSLMDESVLSEASHIICCSYLNAIGELLGIYQLVPSMKQTAIDRVDKLSKVLIKGFVAEEVGYILPIENQLIIEDTKLNLFVIFLLEYESLIKITEIVGL